MTVVLQLKEQLSRLKQRRIELTLSADASIRAARELLAASAVTPLVEIRLETARLHLDHAIKDQEALTEVLEQIRTIERELGQ